MSKLVVLKLDGDLEQQGFRITLEIGQEGQYPDIATSGALPPNPELAAQLAQWQTHYHRLSAPSRALKPRQIRYDGSLHPIEACLQSAKTLEKQLRLWLQSNSFREIDNQLRQALVQEEPIRILLRTDDQQLHQLPWHVWDVVEQYPKAEVALGAPKFRRPLTQLTRSASATSGVRILAILGDRSNINVEADQQMLTELPGANLTFLVEPSRRVLHDHLCEQPWDILFFAGHSETTEDGEGWIKLNPDVSLTIEELKYGVNRAIAHGLQFAIFNSCDGLGLAHALEELQLPQMIVMRQPIPDPVAQDFLKYFLKAFAGGEPFYLAEREARERLQSLEDQFPCASWLPVIYQHPAAIPATWQQLCRHPEEEEPSEPKTPNSKLKTPLSTSLQRPLGLVCLSSVTVTALVMGLRWFGWLQPWELQSYDRLLRQRPAELPDSRILLVGADERDLQQYGFPVPDAVLVQVIEKLGHHRPAAIGIDIYRDRPVLPGHESFVAELQSNPNVVPVCTWGTDETQAIAPPPDSPVEQIGFADLELDAADAVVRRHVLSRSPNPISPLSPCTTPYSFSLQLVFNYLDRQIPAIPPTLTAEQDWQFDTTIIKRLTPRTGGYQNLDARGNQILINYRATAEIAQQISITALLQDQIDPSWIRDRVVLVGVTAASVQDDQSTPYGRMRGLHIHAHIVSQLLDTILGDYSKVDASHRPLIQAMPQWADALWVLGWTLVGGVLVWHLRVHPTGIPILLNLTIGFGVAVGVLYGSCWFALVQGLWLPLIPTVLALGITGGVMLVLTPGSVVQ
ncbi:CHASE2 domain-containing protein [Oculatella sp. FACHB-28]|uniref:CHASE2 domain-containing protein n=1 Tax=Oculatella sp. FACHB-28 TaxID=2692845 RepID=UPI0016844F16|nr:CHASE2 domain-containing protein [Oculatella sp. FACHB-28]MBD2058093.1 CHASE2 domain-containing protein [Oculatella sp. FACHB-28]